MKTLDQAPRYTVVAGELEARIRGGYLKPGSRLPTFAQMRAQGVSQNTMEKAYALLESNGLIERSGGSGVYVAEESNRDRHAPGLVGFYTFDLGIVRPFGMHLFAAEVQRGALHEAKNHNLQILLLDQPANSETSSHLKGMLTTEEEAVPGLATVCLGRKSNCSSAVVADEAAGVRLAVEHLATLGHKRIAYLITAEEPFHSTRLRAYQDALKEYGLDSSGLFVRHLHGIAAHATFFVGAGKECMTRWLAEDWHALGCTALLCQNDQTAIGAMEALLEAGVRVPEDVSLVGFDGTEAADYCRPRLTTVSLPLYEMGEEAVRLVVRQLGGERDMVTVTLPAILRVAGSSGPAIQPGACGH